MGLCYLSAEEELVLPPTVDKEGSKNSSLAAADAEIAKTVAYWQTIGSSS
jgi:hypothetical protein